MFPGGHAVDDDGMMSIFLWNTSHMKVDIGYKISLIDREGKDRKLCKCSRAAMEGFEHVISLKSDELLEESSNILNKGTLAFKLKLSLADVYSNKETPAFSTIDNMEIFLDEETSDLMFDVRGSMIPTHRCILKSQAKDLYTLAGECGSGKHMPISDVEPDIFKMMLRIYFVGGFILPEEWQQHSKVLLEASDKYGLDKVKGEADIW